MNEIKQKFEAHYNFPADKLPELFKAWRAAYEAGELAMREKAAQLANSCTQILPPEHRVVATWIGDKIRALPLSGAEEATLAELP